MYCFKCGQELRSDAKYCDKCGANQNRKNKWPVVALIFALIVIVVLLICLYITLSAKSKNVSSTPETQTSVIKEISSTEEVVPEKKVEKEKKENSVISFFAGESKLELPSLVSYSKERMTLGNYQEDKASGGFVQYFEAGDDIQIVQCIAEYKDMVSEYGITLTGTLSSSDGEWNYTCYLFEYNGDAGIAKGSINFEDSGNCDLCFVTAVKDGEAHIAAYIPEGVSFVETSEHMRNGY